MAQDDYYYEIQLTNKQLVFYFLAGATGLILSFLAGVMVGRGVDGGGGVQVARTLAEDRIVGEEPRPAPPSAEDLTYARTLEGEQAPEASLDHPVPQATPGPTAAPPPATPQPTPRATPTPRPPAQPPVTVQRRETPPAPVAVQPRPASRLGAPGTFSIQVGAFQDKTSADSIVTQLKAKGFAAFVVAPKETSRLYNVRVGSYPNRAEAERVLVKLRDQEKFQPFIVKQ